ncbi:MAG: sulfurtransferase [Pseudomonadota bacterium]
MQLIISTTRWLLGLGVIIAAFVIFLGSPLFAADIKPLVSVDWLKDNAERQDLVILDIRNKIDGGSAESFTRGHIPGSVHSDYLQGGWRTEVDGVIAQAPSGAQLEALIGNLGIDNDTTVVVVPAGINASDFGSAARVYWTFKYAGHDTVAILDGGYRAWTADPSNPIETGPSAPLATIFEANLRPEMRVDGATVHAALDDGETMLLDGRPAEQFTGKAKHNAAKAAGHIPGAVHFDQAQTFDATSGKLLDLAKLKGLLPEGLTEAEEVVSYCNTGHWAAVNWFVLSEVAGLSTIKLYDGSMVEWTQTATRPVAQSPNS